MQPVFVLDGVRIWHGGICLYVWISYISNVQVIQENFTTLSTEVTEKTFLFRVDYHTEMYIRLQIEHVSGMGCITFRSVCITGYGISTRNQELRPLVEPSSVTV